MHFPKVKRPSACRSSKRWPTSIPRVLPISNGVKASLDAVKASLVLGSLPEFLGCLMRSVSKWWKPKHEMRIYILGFSNLQQHVRPILRLRLSPSGMVVLLTGTGSGPMSDANGGEVCSYFRWEDSISTVLQVVLMNVFSRWMHSLTYLTGKKKEQQCKLREVVSHALHTTAASTCCLSAWVCVRNVDIDGFLE